MDDLQEKRPQTLREAVNASEPLRDGTYPPHFTLEGNKLTLNLDTYNGRQAARMLAVSYLTIDPWICRALLARVGLEY